MINELDVAKQIAAGELSSPQLLDNCALFALRVTGTGVAFRSKIDQFVYRDPSFYMNQEFIERCSGIPVIWEHPDTKSGMLDSKEFAERVIGSIMFGYPVEDDQVWGIARIYDTDAIDAMMASQLSTSPCVAFAGGEVRQGEDGEPILFEHEPVFLDHLAICEQGVWDKEAGPTGIDIQIAGDSMPTEMETPAAAPSLEERFAKLEAMVEKIIGAEKAEAAHIQDDSDPSALMADPELGKTEIKAVDASHDLDQNAAVTTDDDMCGSKVASDDDDDDDDDDSNVKEKDQMKDKIVAADAANKELMATIAKLQSRIEAMETGTSDEDRNALSVAQRKADAVYGAFSDSAPAPLSGEKPMAYRRRVLSGLKKYSEAWKTVDISAISDSAVLDIAEEKIFADAVAASSSPAAIGRGNLIARKRQADTGHTIIEYSGDPENAWGAFKHPKAKVSGFNKGVH